MRSFSRFLVFCAMLFLLSGQEILGQQSVELKAPVGFAATTAARQAYCEALFLDLPSSDSVSRVILANRINTSAIFNFSDHCCLHRFLKFDCV